MEFARTNDMPQDPSAASPRLQQMLGRFRALTDMDQIDHDFLHSQDVPLEEMSDWSDRQVHHREAPSEVPNEGSSSGPWKEWITRGFGLQRGQADEDDGFMGMPYSQSLPARLSEAEIVDHEERHECQSLVTMVRTVWSASRSQTPMRAGRASQDDIPDTWDYVPQLQNEAHMTSRQENRLIPSALRPSTSAPDGLRAPSEPTIRRLYRSARVWLSTQEEGLDKAPMPTARHRQYRQRSRATERPMQPIREERGEKRQEDVALDEYLASLDSMLSSVRTQNQGNLSRAHRNAIRAKLEQGIERLNREPPPRELAMRRMEHRLTVLSENYAIPMMVGMAVVMMRITLLIMAMFCHTFGILYDAPQRRIRAAPEQEISRNEHHGAPYTPTSAANRRTYTPVSPQAQSEVNEWLRECEEQPSRSPFPFSPSAGGGRSMYGGLPLQYLLSESADLVRRLTQTPATLALSRQDAPQSLALSHAPAESKRTYPNVTHLSEVFARAVKRSPLPDQVRLLVRMVGATLHHVEQRFGVWRNVSTWLVHGMSALIRFIQAHNIHVLVVRAMLTTLESFFAAIRAYQTEPPPVA